MDIDNMASWNLGITESKVQPFLLQLYSKVSVQCTIVLLGAFGEDDSEP